MPGLGEVYEARDHEQDRDVGLMVLRTDFGADPDRLARFQREASAAALLEHPRILTVHNIGADAQAAYVISEPIQGRTLREVRAGGAIPPGGGGQFMQPIAEALASAHEKGVVHGNLTPDHILFTADGLKVIGFGLAAATGHTATVSGDLAAFDAISEILTSPSVEPRAGRGWSRVAAAIGVLGVAAAIAVLVLGGFIGRFISGAGSPTEPPSSHSPSPDDFGVAGPPSPESAGAAAPTTPETERAPTTTEKEPVPTVEKEPAPTTPRPAPTPKPTPRPPEAAPTIDTPVPTRSKPVPRRPQPTAPIAAPVPPRPRPVPRPRPAPSIRARAATPVGSGPVGTVVPPPPPAGPSRLVWLDRTGVEAGALGDAADYGHVALSPDGTRVAVSIREPDGFAGDIWIIDTSSGTRTRLTSDPADDIAPIWSPDGTRIAYASGRDGSYDIYETASDGTDGARALIAAPGDQVAYDWTPGSGFIMYQADRPGMAAGAHTDLWARRIPGGRAFAFLRSVHRTGFPSSSPDGRRYAFVLTDNSSGLPDVYVARFPKYDGRRRVSTGGGSWPRWRADAIFYVDAENRIVSVPVALARTQLVVRAPSRVAKLAVRQGRGSPYDVSADGQRMLINTVPEDSAETLSRRVP